MAGRPRRTPRDRRRRTDGQNFLVDQRLIARAMHALDPRPGEYVVDLGAGRGALTLPLARAGARVLAVEHDPIWARELRRTLEGAGLSPRVRVLRTDLRRLRLPREPYRVVASPPYSLTTAVLSALLDDPARGPWRADLLLQAEVTGKRAATPPTSLKSAAWAPWWTFEAGTTVPRGAFRPQPRVDSRWLIVRKREMPVLPAWLAPTFMETLRPVWQPPQPPRQR